MADKPRRQRLQIDLTPQAFERLQELKESVGPSRTDCLFEGEEGEDGKLVADGPVSIVKYGEIPSGLAAVHVAEPRPLGTRSLAMEEITFEDRGQYVRAR